MNRVTFPGSCVAHENSFFGEKFPGVMGLIDSTVFF